MAKPPNKPAARRFWRVPTPMVRIYRKDASGVMRQIIRSRGIDRRRALHPRAAKTAGRDRRERRQE
ncbi:MAG TPA: hypothetical protein VK690_01440 [Stellaceae bacterium]|nr:hypothetical protein [Stellaceae bacterium]